jgi:hypothetical protein
MIRSFTPGELPDVNSLPENMIKTIDQNGEQVPPLVGPRFMAHWGAKSTKEYVARVATAIQGFPNGATPGTFSLTAATSVSLSAATGHAPPK